MISTQTLTDLCCVINAFDGYCSEFGSLTKKYQKDSDRQRNTALNCVVQEAEKLWSYGVTLKRLANALKKGGWDDNYFIRENDKLVIKYKI